VTRGSATPATFTLTTTSVNFSGNISLSVSGLPAGMAWALGPSVVPGSGTSTLSIRASPSAPLGTYNVVVRGVADGVSVAAHMTLTVN
jgi:hypothetical protein